MAKYLTKVGQNSLYFAITGLIFVAWNIFLTSLYARYTGGVGLGILVAANILSNFAGIFYLGVPQSVIRFVAYHHAAEEKDQLAKVIQTAMMLTLGLGLVIGGIVYGLGGIFFTQLFTPPEDQTPDLLFAIRITALILVVSGTGAVIEATLQGFQQFRLLALRTVMLVPLQGALVFWVILNDLGLRALIVVNALSVLFSITLNLVILVWKQFSLRLLRPSFDRPTAIQLLRFGFVLFLNDSLAVIHTRADSFIIGLFMPIARMGHYNGALVVANYLLTPSRLFVAPFFPAVSERVAKGDYKALAEGSRTSLRYLMLLVTPMAGGIIALAPLVLDLLYPSEFLVAILSLQLLAVGYMVNALGYPASACLTGLGRPEQIIYNALPAITLMLLLHLLLIPPYGIIGAAVGFLLPTLIFTPLAFWQLSRCLGQVECPTRFSELIPLMSFLRISLASILMVLVLRLFPIGTLSPFSLVFLVPFGVVIYLLTLIFVVKEVNREDLKLIGAMANFHTPGIR